MKTNTPQKKYLRSFHRDLEFKDFSVFRHGPIELAAITCTLNINYDKSRRRIDKSTHFDDLFDTLFKNIESVSILKIVESEKSYINIDLGVASYSESKIVDPHLTLFVNDFDFILLHNSLISENLLSSITITATDDELNKLSEFFAAPVHDYNLVFDRFVLNSRKKIGPKGGLFIQSDS